MKTRIIVGCGLLLTIGSAMAGTWILGQGEAAKDTLVLAAPVTPQKVTPEVIAMWRATAVSSNYQAPRVPL